MNLLGNAIRHTAEGSTVRVRIAGRGAKIEYMVEDEGPGVPETELERIFDIYVTKAGGDSRGAGLGLPLSRRLARLLGGELRAVCRAGSGRPVRAGAPGDTSIMKNTSRMVPAAFRRRAGTFEPMKILVVEDDRKVAGFIEQGLKEEGYVVDVAPDGEEATMLAHVYEYDVILLDIVLPKKNGFQVATELRREGRNTPILMLTSRDAVEDVVRGLDAGADDYLSKPFRSTSCWRASGPSTAAAARSAWRCSATARSRSTGCATSPPSTTSAST